MEDQPATSSSPQRSAWMDAFLPNKEVKITPVLISLNCLVWIVMVVSGISPYGPNGKEAVEWGAVTSSGVAAGEYWRLITSNYVHFGFLHIGMNMLALHQVGRLLERFIGPVRFFTLYTISGIAGSALSAWWGRFDIPAAGASGAILGIVGVLVALLTTNLVDKKVRWPMLKSIGISIGLTILIGFSGRVDNAGHLGGFLAGIIGGYCIYPELKAHFYQRKKQWYGLIAALLIVSGGIGWLTIHVNESTYPTLQQMSANFDERMAVANEGYKSGKFTTAEQISKNVTAVYQSGLLQIDSIFEYELTPEGEIYFANRKKWMNERIQQWKFVEQFHSTGEQRFMDSAKVWSAKADTTLVHMNEPQ